MSLVNKLTGETRDGFKLRKIGQFLESIGAEIGKGTNHQAIAKYPNHNMVCPLDTSTNFDHHVVNWLKKATGYSKKEIYQTLRTYHKSKK